MHVQKNPIMVWSVETVKPRCKQNNFSKHLEISSSSLRVSCNEEAHNISAQSSQPLLQTILRMFKLDCVSTMKIGDIKI